MRLQEEADERDRHDEARVGRKDRDLGSPASSARTASSASSIDGALPSLLPAIPAIPSTNSDAFAASGPNQRPTSKAGEVVHDRRAGVLGLHDAEEPFLRARPRDRRPLLHDRIRQIDLDGLAEPVLRRREQGLERRDRLFGVAQLGSRLPRGVRAPRGMDGHALAGEGLPLGSAPETTVASRTTEASRVAVGASSHSTTARTEPTPITSPAARRVAPSILSPFTQVPFVEPRSSISSPPSAAGRRVPARHHGRVHEHVDVLAPEREGRDDPQALARKRAVLDDQRRH